MTSATRPGTGRWPRWRRPSAGPYRAADTAARYGGEGFAVLLPGADPDAARVVAERVRQAVAALDLSDRPVTVSIGLGCGD
jgi:diguanylate cyclase (GGDEF)-like protein